MHGKGGKGRLYMNNYLLFNAYSYITDLYKHCNIAMTCLHYHVSVTVTSA